MEHTNDLAEKTGPQHDGQDSDCPFCADERVATAVAALGKVFAIEDLYPVTAGHLLIIPRCHTPDFFSMTEAERLTAFQLIDQLKKHIEASDSSVLGFNIGINCGEVAGQTIKHAHIHLIPRRREDTLDPRGGVRGVIPGKMS